MLKSSAFVLLFVLSAVNCQFYSNYEEDGSEGSQTDTQNAESSAYQYNSPSAVDQQYVQPRRNDVEPVNKANHRRTRIRIRSRNYQSEPEYNESQPQDYAPAAEPKTVERVARQERRRARRRQQQAYNTQPVLPPRPYSPSVFENVGLGEAPRGVYIPEDSFLNVLRSPSYRDEPPRAISQPAAALSQTTNARPPVNFVNNEYRPRFFVQPPSDTESKQRTLILPITRPQTEYAISAPSQPTNKNDYSAPPQSTQARAVRTNRRQLSRVQPQTSGQPTVDIDIYRQHPDDIERENVMPQVQYAPVNVRQNSRTVNNRRGVTTYQDSILTPTHYPPSIFEKFSLGEAPNGVYVPEDSLLNVLRNPSNLRQSTPRVSKEDPSEQPSLTDASEYETDIVEEYQPPPRPRKRSSHTTRQTPSTTRTQRRGYINEYDEQPVIQSMHFSSQRRRERRIEDVEDFERQRPAVQHRTQSQRRTAPAPAQVARTL